MKQTVAFGIISALMLMTPVAFAHEGHEQSNQDKPHQQHVKHSSQSADH